MGAAPLVGGLLLGKVMGSSKLKRCSIPRCQGASAAVLWDS